MSDSPNNSPNMFTSTPLIGKVQFHRDHRSEDESGDEDDDYDYHDHEATAPEHNQTFYNIPRASMTDEFQSLPVHTYDSSNQIIDESDTDTNYKTPNTSIYKSNRCHPAYFDITQSNQSTLNNTSNYTETDYIDIPANFREFCKPCTSSAKYTTQSSSIDSKNKKFIRENPNDLKIFRARRLDEYPESDEESEDIALNLMLNVNKEPQYRKNNNWNPNVDEQRKKITKPHMSMETYPCSSQPQKKNRWTPPPNSNVSFIKEDEYQYQQIPPFFCSSDSMDPSTINSCSSGSNEKSLDPIFMKYASKEDLSAKSDSINMLSVVISTVMLLASKSQIPQNYITWTLKYLKCIRNKQGQYPPNIRKIQQMLTLSTPGQGQQKDQEKVQEKEQWQCRDFLAARNPGKRMDLTKTKKKCNK